MIEPCAVQTGEGHTATIYRTTSSQQNLRRKCTNRSLIAHYSPTQTSAFISSQVCREVKNNSEKKGGLQTDTFKQALVKDEAKAQQLLIS